MFKKKKQQEQISNEIYEKNIKYLQKQIDELKQIDLTHQKALELIYHSNKKIGAIKTVGKYWNDFTYETFNDVPITLMCQNACIYTYTFIDSGETYLLMLKRLDSIQGNYYYKVSSVTLKD